MSEINFVWYVGGQMRFSCERCRILHRKCDRSEPCQNCVTSEATCEYVDTKSRKRKLAANKEGRAKKRKTQKNEVQPKNPGPGRGSSYSFPPACPSQTTGKRPYTLLDFEVVKSVGKGIISRGTAENEAESRKKHEEFDRAHEELARRILRMRSEIDQCKSNCGPTTDHENEMSILDVGNHRLSALERGDCGTSATDVTEEEKLSESEPETLAQLITESERVLPEVVSSEDIGVNESGQESTDVTMNRLSMASYLIKLSTPTSGTAPRLEQHAGRAIGEARRESKRPAEFLHGKLSPVGGEEKEIGKMQIGVEEVGEIVKQVGGKKKPALTVRIGASPRSNFSTAVGSEWTEAEAGDYNSRSVEMNDCLMTGKSLSPHSISPSPILSSARTFLPPACLTELLSPLTTSANNKNDAVMTYHTRPTPFLGQNVSSHLMKAMKSNPNYKAEEMIRISPTIETFLLFKTRYLEEFTNALKVYTLPMLRRVAHEGVGLPYHWNQTKQSAASSGGSDDDDLLNYVFQEFHFHSRTTMCGLEELNIATLYDPSTGEVSLKPLDEEKPVSNMVVINSYLADLLTRHHFPSNCVQRVATSTAVNFVKPKDDDRCTLDSLYVHVENRDGSTTPMKVFSRIYYDSRGLAKFVIRTSYYLDHPPFPVSPSTVLQSVVSPRTLNLEPQPRDAGVALAQAWEEEGGGLETPSSCSTLSKSLSPISSFGWAPSSPLLTTSSPNLYRVPSTGEEVQEDSGITWWHDEFMKS